jgi:ribose-phosphate pyrophosphokinase
VSPDAGGIERAVALRNGFKWHGYKNVDLAYMAKVRKVINEVHKVKLIGSVSGKTCIIVDDMIDTAGTLCLAAKHLKE